MPEENPATRKRKVITECCKDSPVEYIDVSPWPVKQILSVFLLTKEYKISVCVCGGVSYLFKLGGVSRQNSMKTDVDIQEARSRKPVLTLLAG